MIQNSFENLQEALLLSLEEKLIDDKEFAVLYEEFTPQNLLFRHWDYQKFSLENKDPAECKVDFRFACGCFTDAGYLHMSEWYRL